jgi:hypothetical protein
LADAAGSAQDRPFRKGDRVVYEGLGFGTVRSEPEVSYVEVVFDDDIAPSRKVSWWALSHVQNAERSDREIKSL